MSRATRMKMILCSLVFSIVILCEASTPDNNLQAAIHSDVSSFDGDILLSEEQKNILFPGKIARRAVVKSLEKKWIDGIVPYEFSTTLNESVKSSIMTAMDQIMLSTDSCVTFRPNQPSDEDYLAFFSGNGCYSFVGRQGGRQDISIGEFCNSKGVIMHEIIHALGRWHEQSRSDRDSYVTINMENIEEGFYDNFVVVIDEETSSQGMEYDFDSIMHYDAYAFSSNQQPTIQPTDQRVALNRLGQREKLSEIDKAHIKELYSCKDTSQWSSWVSWSMCSASCGTGMQQRRRTCIRVEGELSCVGNNTEKRQCTLSICPTESTNKWGEWTIWSKCSKNCGGGLRKRIRMCSQGNECTGNHIESEECNIQKCHQAEWSSWSRWTFCSKTCRNGTRHRSRRCTVISSTSSSSSSSDNLSTDEDQLCSGPSMQSEPCFVNVSCGTDQPGLLCDRLQECEGDICNGYHCSNETCLEGLIHIGCYQIPTRTSDLKPLGISYETEENGSDHLNLAKLLRECGRTTQLRNHSYFALGPGREDCYGSSFNNVSGFIQGGPLDECNGGRTAEKVRSSDTPGEGKISIEVYHIVDKDAFRLSVRTMDDCGVDFCDRDMYCSSGSVSPNVNLGLLKVMFISLLLAVL